MLRSRNFFWVTELSLPNLSNPSSGITSWALYFLTSLNTRAASSTIDSPGTGIAAIRAVAPTTWIIRLLRTSTFLFRISFDKLIRAFRDKMWIASVSRLKSHLSGSWLLIRKMSSSLLMGSPASSTRFSLQLRRIFCNTAASLKDFFRISARTFSSIFVRMKKKDFPCFLISLANMMCFSVNRWLAKIRNVWYLSSCTFWRYVSRSG